MSRRHACVLWIFCGVALIQLWVPLSMIARREATLKHGATFKFRTRPVDPYDAFRGRYVRLRYESNNVATTNATRFYRGQKVYVGIDVDEDGWARLTDIGVERPREGAYLKTQVQYHRNNQDCVRVNLPFDRFYMNEDDAPEAERQYRHASQREDRRAYALVRVRSGRAVIEDLYIEDLPIREFLQRTAEVQSEER